MDIWFQLCDCEFGHLVSIIGYSEFGDLVSTTGDKELYGHLVSIRGDGEIGDFVSTIGDGEFEHLVSIISDSEF